MNEQLNKQDTIGNSVLMHILQFDDESTLLSKVRGLIRKKVNVRLINNDGDTALLIICKRDIDTHIQTEIIKLVCTDKVVNIVNENEETALFIELNRPIYIYENIYVLLHFGANIRHIFLDGCNAFMIAVKKYTSNEFEPFFRLINRLFYNIDVIDNDGNSALMLQQNTVVFEYILIHFNPDIQIQNNNLQNILFVCNDINFRILLLHSDRVGIYIDVNSIDIYGNSILIYLTLMNRLDSIRVVVEYSRIPAVRELIDLDYSNDESALTIALIHNFSDIVSYLVDNGANVNLFVNKKNALMYAIEWSTNIDIVLPRIHINSQNIDGDTALLFACKEMNDETTVTIKKLLAVPGIDVNIQNLDGYSAIMSACITNNIGAVRLLYKIVDSTLVDSNGDNALFIAIMNNNIECARLLVITTNLQSTNRDGEIALMVVEKYNMLDIIDSMHILSSDILYARDTNGDNVFMRACKHANVRFITYLIENQMYEPMGCNFISGWKCAGGENYNFRNNLQMTPFMYCALNDDITIGQMISKHVDLNNRDVNGNTALMIAAIHNNNQFLQHYGVEQRKLFNLKIKNKKGDNILLILAKNHNLLLLPFIQNSQLYLVKNEVNKKSIFSYCYTNVVMFKRVMDTINNIEAVVRILSYDNLIAYIYTHTHTSTIEQFIRIHNILISCIGEHNLYKMLVHVFKQYDVELMYKMFTIISGHLSNTQIAFYPTIVDQIRSINMHVRDTTNVKINYIRFGNRIEHFTRRYDDDIYLLELLTLDFFEEEINIFYIELVFILNVQPYDIDIVSQFGLSAGELIMTKWLGRKYPLHLEYTPTSTYSIFLSQAFVAKTQWKPLHVKNLQSFFMHDGTEIEQADKPNVIFACQNGHLHSVASCGIPSGFIQCGKTDNDDPNGIVCTKIVGGINHMLAPGCYIVYMDAVNSPYVVDVWSGYLSIKTYAVYSKVVEQYNIEVDIYNNRIRPYEYPDSFFLQYIAIDESKYAYEVPQSDSTLQYPCEFMMCDGDNVGYGIEGSYIIPGCNHFICKTCLDILRSSDDEFQKRQCMKCVEQNRTTFFEFGV